jgi:N-glycosidase YbiA
MRKFETHEEIRNILLSTGDEEIIEHTTYDYYWGYGTNGTGKNMLGKILMEIREKLRKSE